MDTATLEPRIVSRQDLSDTDLMDGLTFEDLDLLDPQALASKTCNFGWTYYCDTDGNGGTCRTGWTFKCDGPRKI